MFNDTQCRDFTIYREEKKGYLLFAKVDVETLPIQTEYDSLNIKLFGKEDMLCGPDWMEIREWDLTKVKMLSIGQDEAAFTATFTYGEVVETLHM